MSPQNNSRRSSARWKGFSDVAAAPLLCAGIIGYRALRLSDIQPNQRLGLYYFWGSAHVTIQVARHRGCEVHVFTRSEGHRATGAGTGGGVGRRRGGTLSLAGVTMTPIPELNYDRLLYWERAVRSVANFTRQDAEELLQVAAEIPIHTTVQTFPLEAANEALLALKRSEIDGTAVLVVEQRIPGQ